MRAWTGNGLISLGVGDALPFSPSDMGAVHSDRYAATTIAVFYGRRYS